MSWRRNFMPYLPYARSADKRLLVWWIGVVSYPPAYEILALLALPPRFLVVSNRVSWVTGVYDVAIRYRDSILMHKATLELLKGTLDLLILRSLELQPMHGSAI